MAYNNLSELFKATADAIRSKTGGIEPIVANDFPEAIEGIEVDGDLIDLNRQLAELEQQNSELEQWKEDNTFAAEYFADRTREDTTEYMFYGCKNLTTVPLFDTSNVVYMQNMFRGCTNLRTLPLFDTNKVTRMDNMFTGCGSLTAIPLFDMRNVINTNSMFYSCTKLTTIPLLDMRNATDMSGMFFLCSHLTDCYLRNIQSSLSFPSSSFLTLDSLIHLIKECRDTGSQKTLIIGSVNLEKLANTYVRTIAITDEMRAEDDLIDEKLPFELCESTDEGAMHIVAYAATKNWNVV